MSPPHHSTTPPPFYLKVKYLLIIYTAIIILLAVLPINGTNSFLNDNFILRIRLDYLAHFAIFIPWMAIAWFFRSTGKNRSTRRIITWILLGITLAVSTEFVQYLLPYRSFNINDLAANLIGVALGSVIFLFKPPGGREDGKTGRREDGKTGRQFNSLTI
jgi:VanZ family protein